MSCVTNKMVLIMARIGQYIVIAVVVDDEKYKKK